MNKKLSDHDFDNCLELLYLGLVAVRAAARSGDSAACEEISDALHNLPDLLRRGDRFGWTTATFVHLFLEPLAATNPAFADWPERLTRAEERGDS